MKTIVDDRLKLVSIVGIEYELSLSLYQLLKSKPDKRAMLAGHWRSDGETNTISLVMLTAEQVVMLDVLMCDRLRTVSDMVECLDCALEMAL